jgi:hypothetical protein
MSETPPSQRTHPQVDEMMATRLFQSILVTHFHHWEPPNNNDDNGARSNSGSNTSSNNNYPDGARQGQHEAYYYAVDEQDEDEEESFDPPWPSQHEAFCALPVVQEHVVLEIAAGRNSRGRLVPPMEVPKGPLMRVVLPGSLRERGEFCIVDISFMKDPPLSAAAAAAAAAAASAGASSSISIPAVVAFGSGGRHHQPRPAPATKKNGRAPESNEKQAAAARIKDEYRWRVRRTRFYNLNEFL